MRTSHFLIFGLAAISLATTAAAQEPAPLFPGILRDLENSATHDSAVERLKTLKESDLCAAFEAGDDASIPKSVQRDLAITLPPLIEKIRDKRRARDQADDDALQEVIGVEAYKQYGHHDPRWDAAALKALSVKEISTASYEAYKAVINLGCDDPMIRYYYATRANDCGQMDQATALNQLMHILPKVDASAYPAGRKLYIHLRYLSLGVSGQPMPFDTASGQESFRQVINLLPAAAPSLSAMAQEEIANHLWFAAQRVWEDRETAFKHYDEPVHAAFPHCSMVAHMEAKFYTDWAWDARGNGYASTVTTQGWKLFDARLSMARKAAVAGWRADPLSSECAADMITICMGQNTDQPEMERWFSRAMLADPDNFRACSAKLTYLQPKWHGSAEEALDFGGACMDQGNGHNRIPTLMISALLQMRDQNDDPSAFMALPAVWSGISAACDKLLSDRDDLKTHREQYLTDRANYLNYAYQCRQWAALVGLLDKFGAEVDLKTLGGKDRLAFYRRIAIEQLQKRPV